MAKSLKPGMAKAKSKVKADKGAASKAASQAAAISKQGPNITYLKTMAKNLGMVNYSRLGKTDLTRAIQSAEGNVPCYATSMHDCQEYECLFRQSCLG